MDSGITPGDAETYRIIGAAMEVHRVMGRGHREDFLSQALAIEFALRGIAFLREVPCRVSYKGRVLMGTGRVDFVCLGTIAVEVKARSALTPADCAQLIGYLASNDYDRGLLLNFGGPRLEYRRLVGPAFRQVRDEGD